jgi:hypothetical protein
MPDSPQDKLSPEFWSWLQRHPDATVAAIIRTERLSPEIEQAVREAGCRVVRRLQLLPSLAVEGPGSALLELAAQPWVQRIESDQIMRAF